MARLASIPGRATPCSADSTEPQPQFPSGRFGGDPPEGKVTYRTVAMAFHQKAPRRGLEPLTCGLEVGGISVHTVHGVIKHWVAGSDDVHRVRDFHWPRYILRYTGDR